MALPGNSKAPPEYVVAMCCQQYWKYLSCIYFCPEDCLAGNSQSSKGSQFSILNGSLHLTKTPGSSPQHYLLLGFLASLLLSSPSELKTSLFFRTTTGCLMSWIIHNSHFFNFLCLQIQLQLKCLRNGAHKALHTLIGIAHPMRALDHGSGMKQSIVVQNGVLGQLKPVGALERTYVKSWKMISSTLLPTLTFSWAPIKIPFVHSIISQCWKQKCSLKYCWIIIHLLPLPHFCMAERFIKQSCSLGIFWEAFISHHGRSNSQSVEAGSRLLTRHSWGRSI